MIDARVFDDIKGVFAAAIVIAALLGGGFAAGCFIRGCDGHPVIRWEKQADGGGS